MKDTGLSEHVILEANKAVEGILVVEEQASEAAAQRTGVRLESILLRMGTRRLFVNTALQRAQFVSFRKSTLLLYVIQ